MDSPFFRRTCYFAEHTIKRRILKNVKMLIIEFIPHHLRYVVNVRVVDFVAELKPIFNFLYIPSLKMKATKAEFKPMLQQMYEHGLGNEGLIFTKRELPKSVVNYRRFKPPK